MPAHNLPAAVQRIPGIYYALPLTELNATVPLTVEITVASRWPGLESCLVACSGVAAGPCGVAITPPVSAVHAALATVSTASVADPDHVYRVEPGTDNLFMAVSHDFTLEAGRLKSAGLTGNNQTASVLLSAVGSVVGLTDLGRGVQAAAGGSPLTFGGHIAQPGANKPNASGRPPSAGAAATPAASKCESGVIPEADKVLLAGLTGLDRDEAIVQRVASSFKKAAPLACAAIQCVSDTIYAMRRNAGQEVEDANQFLVGTAAPAADLAALRVARAEARSATLLARAAALKVALGLGGKATSTAVVTARPRVAMRASASAPTPEHFAYSQKTWRIDGPADLSVEEAQPYVDAAHATLVAQELKVTVTRISAAVAQAPAPAASASPQVGSGYRYRMPAQGRVTVLLGPRTLADVQVPMAQFGDVAALPAHFTGTEASLSFSLADDGTLSSVKLGQKAQSGAALNTLAADLKKREAEREGLPLKDAKADTDLAAERIKAAKQRRCLEALSAAAPDAAWPEVCK